MAHASNALVESYSSGDNFSSGAGTPENSASEYVAATAGGRDAFASDALAHLLEPDVVLPSQFLSREKRGVKGGERRLMAAILSDGIEAYISQVSAQLEGRRLARTDALEWVETKDHNYVFSFDMVCESLGINPEYLRFGLARYVAAVTDARRRGERPAQAWKKIRRPRKR